MSNPRRRAPLASNRNLLVTFMRPRSVLNQTRSCSGPKIPLPLYHGQLGTPRPAFPRPSDLDRLGKSFSPSASHARSQLTLLASCQRPWLPLCILHPSHSVGKRARVSRSPTPWHSDWESHVLSSSRRQLPPEPHAHTRARRDGRLLEEHLPNMGQIVRLIAHVSSHGGPSDVQSRARGPSFNHSPRAADRTRKS